MSHEALKKRLLLKPEDTSNSIRAYKLLELPVAISQQNQVCAPTFHSCILEETNLVRFRVHGETMSKYASCGSSIWYIRNLNGKKVSQYFTL